MTNSSLRQRFGIEKQNSATASRIFREATGDGLVKPIAPNQGKKYAKYLPHCALYVLPPLMPLFLQLVATDGTRNLPLALLI